MAFCSRIAVALVCLGFIGNYDCLGRPDVAGQIPNQVEFMVGSQGYLAVNLSIQNGEKVLFLLDTGFPFTVFDKSLEPSLGQSVGTKRLLNEYDVRASSHRRYKCPALYLGNTRLKTDSTVVIEDLKKVFPNDSFQGILGLDCLKHYCLRFNFRKREITFLDPKTAPEADDGEPIKLSISRFYWPGHPIAHLQFITKENQDWVIDTGCPVDGQLDSKRLNKVMTRQQPAWSTKAANNFGLSIPINRFATGWFGTNSYSNLTFTTGRHNLIGLNFLARHEVTLNFPQGIMYLKRYTNEFR